MNEYLPLPTLLRLLGVLTLCLLPHFTRLPWWETLLILALLVWRGLAAYRQWRMPPTAIKLSLTLLIFLALLGQYGGMSGQTAGTAMLCAMAALKLLEFKGRRDVMVVVFLMYFMLLTHFLFSQELWTVAYLLLCALAITATLIECQHRGALPVRRTLRKSGGMVLQAVPLMLLMFVLFPRIPGPLWGLPSDAGAARSGLGDQMSPGDISSLIRSDEVAFRVDFSGPAPAPQHRYWRGPVFDRFDGRAWREGFGDIPLRGPAPDVQLDGPPVDYVITLEPQRSAWLFALDMPDAASIPADAGFGREAQLMAGKPVAERRRYTLRSHTQYLLAPALSERDRARYLRLPPDFNPRTLALAASLRSQHRDDHALIRAQLQTFNQQDYVYTLDPPPLGRDAVDEFLFDTRRGFCEHYASAFTTLMRAAGIPARVVTGYQGGQRNDVGGYYVVRQSDAHAWSEVWLAGEGWVRVDPTAAVAPERIEENLEAALDAVGEALPGFLGDRTRLRYYLEARWDWINAQWNGLVLAYGPELQQQLLSRFGLGGMREMILALTVGVTGLLALFGALTLRRYLPAHSEDAALRAWQQLQRRLARAGHPPRSEEGPRDYIARVTRARPDWAPALDPIASLYLDTRYQLSPSGADAATLRRAVAAFRP